MRLWDGRGYKTRLVHRLVLETFVGAAPAGMEGCHNDGNRFNKRLENLRWDTPKAIVSTSAGMGRIWPARGIRRRA